MLDDNFSNVESAEISMSSTTRWLTGSEGTADGDGVVNTDAVPDGTEEQTTELSGGQTTDTYDESTVSQSHNFPGKMHMDNGQVRPMTQPKQMVSST